jgi:hypothetical protein
MLPAGFFIGLFFDIEGGNVHSSEKFVVFNKIHCVISETMELFVTINVVNPNSSTINCKRNLLRVAGLIPDFTGFFN